MYVCVCVCVYMCVCVRARARASARVHVCELCVKREGHTNTTDTYLPQSSLHAVLEQCATSDVLRHSQS